MTALIRVLLAVLLVTPVTGCYRYSDVSVGAVRPGTRVRARISAAEAEQIATQLGGVRRVIEGEVVAADASAVMLEIPSDIAPGSSGSALRQRVAIPPGSILELQERELDRARTAGVVAAGLAVATAVALAIDAGVLGGGNEKPGNDAILIPVGRLPLPR